MKPLTDKQKKAAWITAGVLIVLHFLPNLTAPLFSAFGHRHQPVAMQPRQVVPPPAKPISNAAPAFDPLTAQFIGVFQGQQLMPDMSNCRMKLEVRPTLAKAGFYSGFEQMSCVPSPLFYKGPLTAERKGQLPNIIAEASPVSASMTDSVSEGVMTFRVDGSDRRYAAALRPDHLQHLQLWQQSAHGAVGSPPLPRRSHDPAKSAGVSMARQEPHPSPEPFVSAEEAATYLSINRRFLLSLARRGIAGAYPLGTGECRHIWGD